MVQVRSIAGSGELLEMGAPPSRSRYRPTLPGLLNASPLGRSDRTPPPICTEVGGSLADFHLRECCWGLLVLCHLCHLLLGCREEIRRHYEDREYCWRAASWRWYGLRVRGSRREPKQPKTSPCRLYSSRVRTCIAIKRSASTRDSNREVTTKLTRIKFSFRLLLTGTPL